jgi:glycosyltransferase involved in cell wall biosynthesis
MNLLLVAEALGAQDGWASSARGLLLGLTSRGVRAKVVLDRRAVPDALAGVTAIPCLSSPLGALDRPSAIAWNALQLLRHSRGADLLHFMVEPYATAALPAGLPPHCVTVHGTYALSPFDDGPLTRALYATALRRADRIICASRFTRDALLSKLQLGNVTVIHHGHELQSADDGDDTDQSRLEGRPIIIGVGALKPRKGYHVSLRAIARLKDRYPQLRYYMLGDDADRKYVSRLRADIKELGLEQHAIIHGPVEHARLPAYYRQADLFLLTPVNVDHRFEGFGIVYLEAGFFGKPVVGSYGCGAEEAVEDGANGLLAQQGDDRAIAERAATILGDLALAARLGQAGRQRAERQTWNAVADQYLEVYEQALRR